MQNRAWCVLQVLSNQEKRVAQHLTSRGVEHYLPLYSERSQWSDRTVTLARPLFPGYVFTRFSTEKKLPIISTPGVVRLLGTEATHTVSEAEMSRIRQGLDGQCVLRPHPSVEAGTKVRILRGAFAGSEGVVCELRRKCSVVITLSATHQCFSLEVDLENIEVLDKPACEADDTTARANMQFAD